MRRKLHRLGRARDMMRGRSIQMTIAIPFTIVAVCAMVMVGIILYAQFAQNLRETILQENRQLVNQISLNLNSYTSRMRGISDALYYNVIKNADLDEQNISREMSLLYEANTDVLVSIALYTDWGELVAAAPNANAKADVDVTEQEWFQRAINTIENSHFSTPHVQNLYEENLTRHNWVISLSRMAELNWGGSTGRGVLLVDMNFSGIELIFQRMSSETSGYTYLIDKSGEIIYHPKQKLIYSGLYDENNLAAAQYPDGILEESFDGTDRQVIVKTVSYTGWKIVTVIPNSAFAVSFNQLRLLVIAIVGLAVFLIILVNAFVSSLVAGPIKKLDESVRELEKGILDLEVYIGGPYEVEHLGRTIRSTVSRMRELMDDIVREQELQRKREFDALQAQINPHFLYNTLDSIVWMIESGQNREAISMVTSLANLFRISLSKGKNIITIKSELQHAMHYLHIQGIRYKNKFSVETDVDPEIESYTTIKLVIQPLLENAIYHAIELMDGDGVIRIRGYRRGESIYIEVTDNGLGMPAEKVATLLEGAEPGESKRGSGIGLKNVHQRIRLYYGPEYGLQVESEADVGTTVRIHLPAMTETEALERGGD